MWGVLGVNEGFSWKLSLINWWIVQARVCVESKKGRNMEKEIWVEMIGHMQKGNENDELVSLEQEIIVRKQAK